MTLTKEELCGLIPHAGDMCLLESVVRWDDATILCTSRTHLDPHNPLCNAGCLQAICGIEYAAQAMAVHGALVAGKPSSSGYLASVRDVHLIAARLDTVREELHVEARRLAGDAGSVIYRFSVGAGGRELLHGRASVVLQWVDRPA